MIGQTIEAFRRKQRGIFNQKNSEQLQEHLFCVKEIHSSDLKLHFGEAYLFFKQDRVVGKKPRGFLA